MGELVVVVESGGGETLGAGREERRGEAGRTGEVGVLEWELESCGWLWIWYQDLALEKTQRGRRYGKSAESQKLK